ncbi:AAA family ATPase [Nitrospira sp. Ecomares 2.1]
MKRENGFQLVRVALTGIGVEDAEVRFSSGLNVISGPSDTGKTFILQCIDYLLGAGAAPKEIPEARSYDTAVLEVKALADNATFVLSRALRGGAFTLRRPDGSESVLREKHEGDRDDTVSHFFLDLAGLTGKLVRTNIRGETRPLSFRDLAHLIVISEEDIIRTRSPLLSGQYTTKTVEKSVFRLMLSGQDDSAVVASEDRRVSQARLDAKGEVLEQLANQIRDQLAEIGTQEDASELRARMDRLDATLEETALRLSALGSSVNEIENHRRQAWTRLRQMESRFEVLRGLSERFALLANQYNSDLQRLEAIKEASARLNDLGEERCPVCGALPEHHEDDHRSQRADPVAVAEASAAEANRIRSLISDLTATRREVTEETSQLQSEKAGLQGQLSDLNSALAARLRPQAYELTQVLRSTRDERDRVRQALDQYKQLEEVEGLAGSLEARSTSTQTPATAEISASDLEEFAQEVEERLRSWKFPGLQRVTFSEEDWDVVVSGRRRTSHGKGVRAVTHAAFTSALLGYCLSRLLPHPGFSVMDSPLVVYREPDSNDPELSADLKGAFFRDLAEAFSDSQIVILENEAPPTDLIDASAITSIKFTGTSTGRKGFIPAPR